MGRQSTCKRIRGAVDKQKSKIILEYMRNHWDVVLNSSVSMLKTLSFSTRFRFAMDILVGKKKKAMRAMREPRPKHDEKPGIKAASAVPEKPGAEPAASKI
jgi:hypothetical protein